MIRRFLFLLVPVLACTLHAGQRHADVIQQAGFADQLQQYGDMIRANLGMARGSMTAERQRELDAEINTLLNPAALLEPLRERLEISLNSDDLDKVESWLSGPLASRITELEKQAASKESYREMLEQAENLLADAERFRLVSRIDKGIQGTETSLRIMLHAQEAVLKQTGADEATLEQLRASVMSNEPAVASQVRLGLLFTLKELSNADLETYADFAESETGRRWFAAVSGGLQDAIVQASSRVAELTKEYFDR